MLDKDAKPWLLEVNQSPSFTTDTPLDHRIKKNLIVDAIRMLGLSV
jgi:D-alanine-D-alanine ligase-like ATP-grasp enzyme